MERLNLDRFKILAAAATLAMFAGTACAETELYGWVNRAIMHTDDGFEQSTLFVDNAFNQSTLGVKSMGHLNKCVMFGGVLEAYFNVNNSRSVGQLANVNLETNTVLVRTADTWVDLGVWGKLTLGYGYASSYKIMQMSYSGAGDTVSSAEVANLAGGMHFHPSTGAASLVRTTILNPSVNEAFNVPDGVGSIDSITGRYASKNRIRYDSDKWCGLGLSASFGSVQPRDVLEFDYDLFSVSSRQYVDVALRYEGNFCDFLLSGGVAWAKYTRDGMITDDSGVTVAAANRGVRLWAGSVAAEHKCTGLNVAVAYGNQRKIFESLNNQKVWFFQVGDRLCLTHYGKTNVVLDYYWGRNALVNNDRAQSYAVGVVQDFDKVNTSLYATVRAYKLSDSVNELGDPTSFDRIWVASAGILFKFGAML
jgi:hypothetical protein